jgi:hypothetical protein
LVAIVISRKKQVYIKDKHSPFPHLFSVEANKREFLEKKRCLDEVGARNKRVNHSVLKWREIDVFRKEDTFFYRIKSKNVVLNVEVKLQQHKKNVIF